MSTLSVLAKLISSSVEKIENSCARRNVQFPDINDPFTLESEQARLDPEIAEACASVVAATAQLSAIVNRPNLSIVTTAMQFHVCSSLRFVERTHTAEILREAGRKGLHVKEISAINKANPEKLARILRLLATEHIFREVEPDVFANNRISSLLDTGKTYNEIIASPEDKFENTLGIASTVALYVDEGFKASAYMTETLLDEKFAYSQGPTETAFNRALNVQDENLFTWLARPENDFRRRRFGMAMEGISNMFPSRSVSQCSEWDMLKKLPKGSVVVDVGGGIGSVSLGLAREFTHLNFVVQDQASVIKDADKFWQSKLPDALTSNRVQFQAHNFFDPQPVKGASVYMMRMIIHDWSDPYCHTILKHLRDVASPDTHLLIVETMISYACADATQDTIPGASGPIPPPVLLPNWGHAKFFDFVHDLQMFIMLNGKERTLSEFQELLASVG